MSTDYYLVSRAHKRGAQVGSSGLFVTQSYPGAQEVVDFIRWAIDESVSDVEMVSEYHFHDIVPDYHEQRRKQEKEQKA